jgi:hypothetical protein
MFVKLSMLPYDTTADEKRAEPEALWEKPTRRTRPENIGAAGARYQFGLNIAGNSDWLPPLLLPCALGLFVAGKLILTIGCAL